MIKRLFILILAATGLALAAPGADRRSTQGDRVYLQSGSGLRISVETHRVQKGLTPVIVSVGGAEIQAVMDEKGRVLPSWAKGLGHRGVPLFRIELEKGLILPGGETHGIRIYEQNGIRTRIEIADGVIALPLRLDQTGGAGTLFLGGLEIPARTAAAGTARMTAKGASAPNLVTKGRGSEARLLPTRIRVRGKSGK